MESVLSAESVQPCRGKLIATSAAKKANGAPKKSGVK
jgi:hypothetical protein